MFHRSQFQRLFCIFLDFILFYFQTQAMSRAGNCPGATKTENQKQLAQLKWNQKNIPDERGRTFLLLIPAKKSNFRKKRNQGGVDSIRSTIDPLRQGQEIRTQFELTVAEFSYRHCSALSCFYVAIASSEFYL